MALAQPVLHVITKKSALALLNAKAKLAVMKIAAAENALAPVPGLTLVLIILVWQMVLAEQRIILLRLVVLLRIRLSVVLRARILVIMDHMVAVKH
jgi:hypothetical protein